MKEKITLVKGHFSPAEAADVLISLINDKIKFHTVQALNIAGGLQAKPSDTSEKRINELIKAKDRVQQLVLLAHKTGAVLEINSDIHIQIKTRKPNQEP